MTYYLYIKRSIIPNSKSKDCYIVTRRDIIPEDKDRYDFWNIIKVLDRTWSFKTVREGNVELLNKSYIVYSSEDYEDVLGYYLITEKL